MTEVVWRRVAAYVVCRDQDGRTLLTRFFEEENPDSGCWTLPGGGMERGEQPVDTATRELEEKTGFKRESDLYSPCSLDGSNRTRQHTVNRATYSA